MLIRGAATSLTTADVYVVIDLDKGGVAYREDKVAGKRRRPAEPPRAQRTINLLCKNRSAEVARRLARGARALTHDRCSRIRLTLRLDVLSPKQRNRDVSSGLWQANRAFSSLKWRIIPVGGAEGYSRLFITLGASVKYRRLLW